MWKSKQVLKGAGVLTAFAAAAVGIQVNRRQNLPELDAEIRPACIDNESVVRVQSSPNRPRHCYREAIRRSRQLISRYKEEVGAPGIVAGVSVDGRIVWQEGFGYADLENMVPCTADTVIRIASISKSLTMAAVAKLWEEGKLDLDKPVQEYVPSFPEKIVDGERVTLTCRHLLSNMGGVRHYDKVPEKDRVKSGLSQNVEELEQKEYFVKDNYATIGEALTMFKDDPLHFKPGTQYLYSTHGWTLVSAIVEAASKTPYTEQMKNMLRTFGMHSTYLDVNDNLIPHRARYYMKNKHGRVVNAPYVDNSYKWAGGGFLSTPSDLLRFANVMLYSYQQREQDVATTIPSTNVIGRSPPGFLRHETVERIWTPVHTFPKVTWANSAAYAMGWIVTAPKQEVGCGHVQREVVTHTGAAIGASSVLYLLLPEERAASGGAERVQSTPKGTAVAIITNLHKVALLKLAQEIAQIFDACR